MNIQGTSDENVESLSRSPGSHLSEFWVKRSSCVTSFDKHHRASLSQFNFFSLVWCEAEILGGDVYVKRLPSYTVVENIEATCILSAAYGL